MSVLKNYREVGLFDVLIAPVSPLKTFDAETFKTDAAQLLDGSTINLVVDLADLDFLYSDAYNAFMVIQSRVALKNGVFGILTSNDIIVKGLQQAGLDRLVHVFHREADVMGFSLASGNRAESPLPDSEHAERSTVISQNAPSGDALQTRSHRLTQSYNAIGPSNAEDVKGMGDPFTDKSNTASRGNVVRLVLGASGVLVLLALAFLFLR